MVGAQLNRQESLIMKRNLLAGLVLSLLASAPAFADGGNGIGRAGTYNDYSWTGTSTKTRAEVRAEIAQAQRDGTLPTVNKNTYPAPSMAAQTQAARTAAQANNSPTSVAGAGH
jgi:hypothetical protein